MNKYLYIESILLHQIIRSKIYETDYIKTIHFLSRHLYKELDIKHISKKFSIKKINKILCNIVKLDLQNDLVSSCISISLLGHILCSFSNIKSQICIGVKIENEKVVSHSWLLLNNGKVLNYFTDYHDYIIIKKFSLEDL